MSSLIDILLAVFLVIVIIWAFTGYPEFLAVVWAVLMVVIIFYVSISKGH